MKTTISSTRYARLDWMRQCEDFMQELGITIKPSKETLIWLYDNTDRDTLRAVIYAANADKLDGITIAYAKATISEYNSHIEQGKRYRHPHDR